MYMLGAGSRGARAKDRAERRGACEWCHPYGHLSKTQTAHTGGAALTPRQPRTHSLTRHEQAATATLHPGGRLVRERTADAVRIVVASHGALYPTSGGSCGVDANSKSAAAGVQRLAVEVSVLSAPALVALAKGGWSTHRYRVHVR
jgi:hypothetical protein